MIVYVAEINNDNNKRCIMHTLFGSHVIGWGSLMPMPKLKGMENWSFVCPEAAKTQRFGEC